MKISAALAFIAVGFAQESPVIKVDTRLVQFSVIVLDKNDKNAPVAGLKKEDFTLVDHGKVRPISLFQVADSRLAPASERPRTPAITLDPGVFTNEINAAPNATVVMFDAINTAFPDRAYARLQIVKLIEQLKPADRLAIYLLDRKGVHVIHDFSSDTASLIETIKAIRPMLADPDFGASGNAQVDTLRATMPGAGALIEMTIAANAALQLQQARSSVGFTQQALISIAQHFASVPGRKSLIWISSGFPISIGDSRNLTTFALSVDRASKALIDANVHVYPVDPKGVLGASVYTAETPTSHADTRSETPQLPSQVLGSPEHDTMQKIADRTGGKAYLNQNNIADSVRHAIDDATLTYTLGFYLPQNEMDGKYHETKITVTHKGLIVQARKGYFAFGSPVEQDPAIRRQIIGQAARAPLDATALPIRMRIDKSADSKSAHIVCAFDPKSLTFLQAQGKYTAALEILLAQVSDAGNNLTTLPKAFGLNYSPERYEQVLRDGIDWETTVVLRPGTKKIRVVLFDRNSGSVGSLTAPASGNFALQTRPAAD